MAIFNSYIKLPESTALAQSHMCCAFIILQLDGEGTRFTGSATQSSRISTISDLSIGTGQPGRRPGEGGSDWPKLWKMCIDYKSLQRNESLRDFVVEAELWETLGCIWQPCFPDARVVLKPSAGDHCGIILCVALGRHELLNLHHILQSHIRHGGHVVCGEHLRFCGWIP